MSGGGAPKISVVRSRPGSWLVKTSPCPLSDCVLIAAVGNRTRSQRDGMNDGQPGEKKMAVVEMEQGLVIASSYLRKSQDQGSRWRNEKACRKVKEQDAHMAYHATGQRAGPESLENSSQLFVALRSFAERRTQNAERQGVQLYLTVREHCAKYRHRSFIRRGRSFEAAGSWKSSAGCSGTLLDAAGAP